MKLSTFVIPFTLLACVFLNANASPPEMRCHTDSFGNQTCQDNKGNSWFGRTDSSGNETYLA